MSETQETWEKLYRDDGDGEMRFADGSLVCMIHDSKGIVAYDVAEPDADLICNLHNERAGLELAQAGAKKLWAAHHALTAALAEKDNLAREVGSLIADLQTARSALEARGRAIDALVSERDSLAGQLQAEREKAALAQRYREALERIELTTHGSAANSTRLSLSRRVNQEARDALVTPATQAK